jgi:16S rRNA (cytosine967-C5)-methyltransferase
LKALLMAVSPARATAFEILMRVAQQRSYASELLHSDLCSPLSQKDRALATELVMGVLRWQSVIDAAVAEASSLSLAKLDAEVLIALRLATFQLLWLDRVPPHAAIYESVELVKQARKRSAVPFANAVLRKVAQSRDANRPKPDEPARDPEMLATFSAHPGWLVQRWYSRYGADAAHQICSYDQAIPPTTIRLRGSSAEDALRDEGISLAPGQFLTAARRVLSGNVTQMKAFDQKLIVIQDEASQLVAAIVGSGSRFLDCCAAPGGKTLTIADRNPAAKIVAVELHAHRARLLKERVTAPNVQVINADMSTLAFDAQFDRVLVDAPCSGTGTLARNPEIKWRLQQHDLPDLHRRQTAILNSAMDKLAPGGELVYATCSLEHEEGETVIEEALKENKRFRISNIAEKLNQLRDSEELLVEDPSSLIHGPYLRTIPGKHQCDGFFVAILKRIS